MKNIIFIYSMLILLSCDNSPNKNNKKTDDVPKSISHDDWQKPFHNTIERFKHKEWISHKLSNKDFDIQSKKIINFLVNNRSDWKDYVLRITTPEDSLKLGNLGNKKQDEFSKFDYIKHVFKTKPGTLVFILKEYPELVIKLDNRSSDVFTDLEKDYLTAHKRREKIRKHQGIAAFEYLYFPDEIGVNISSVKTVISENIPFFSQSEIDQFVLLILMQLEAKKDKEFKSQLKTMYEEMIVYVCHMDFDDINLRNMPLTDDGLLAPFDTDSYSAQTGVFGFMEKFFGTQIFQSYEDVKTIINKHCSEKIKNTIKNRFEKISGINPFVNPKEAQDKFDKQVKYLDELKEFYKQRKISDDPKVIEDEWINLAKSPGLSPTQIDIAQKMGHLLKEKFEKNAQKNLKFLGQRCWHLGDIRNQFITPSYNHSKEAWSILDLARKNGIAFNPSKDIPESPLPFDVGIEDFMCF